MECERFLRIFVFYLKNCGNEAYTFSLELFSCRNVSEPTFHALVFKIQGFCILYFEWSSVEKTEWAMHESQLNSRAVHIVDAQTAVFVWEGRKSQRILRRAALQLANMLLTMIIRQDDEAGVLIEKQGFVAFSSSSFRSRSTHSLGFFKLKVGSVLFELKMGDLLVAYSSLL